MWGLASQPLLNNLSQASRDNNEIYCYVKLETRGDKTSINTRVEKNSFYFAYKKIIVGPCTILLLLVSNLIF